jgi:tRNA A-37 threonylcarbamoyl transferase component Bud32
MTPERWREIRAVFDRLAPASAAARERELARLAESDVDLAEEVRALLAAEARDERFLEGPASSGSDRSDERGGERVGPWELLSPLGEGGMGRVFLARRADAAFDKLVAVKFVHAELLSPWLLERFAAERQALAALEHPGIARLLDGGESAGGEPYLVLEYVDGRTLLDFATAERLGRRARIELFLQILAAVAHAHRHLVVHRDLKPSNILVTAAGEAKLLDFGVAKVLAPPSGTASAAATRTFLRALTPEYASPEQVLGGATTTATDVYALGVVLFELLTGRRPYRVPTGAPEEWAEAALSQEVAPARELGRDLEAILFRALRKDPAERYSGAEAFADDLRRYLDGRPVAARRASLADRGLKFVRRHRLAAALAAAALLAIVGTAVVALAQAAEARRERDLAQRRFAQVRELAGVFLFDVHDAVAPLAGSTEARSLLVSTGLRYLHQLAA